MRHPGRGRDLWRAETSARREPPRTPASAGTTLHAGMTKDGEIGGEESGRDVQPIRFASMIFTGCLISCPFIDPDPPGHVLAARMRCSTGLPETSRPKAA